MFFDRFPCVRRPALTGCLQEDVRNLLEANGKPRTAAHVQDVSSVNAALAIRFGLDEEKARAAGLLHDIAAVIPPADMLEYIDERRLGACPAERRHPFLLHQRLSRLIAEEHFNVTDEEILSPVACHTTLRENASLCDMSLFIADKLAWDQEGVPPFDAAVRAALARSLGAACLAYMDYMTDNGRILSPHTDWTAAHRWLKDRF